jgi:succinyl-CoA synthetase alpha subunit
VRSARLGQSNGVGIFGGNSLGVADAWNQVRIGGALGGDDPGGSLRRGSIAILSNSGGFTTTIATYLRMARWGTTTLISSGKDVYIHYAAPEFAFALANDARSKAAVLYWEPGGYYELEAEFTKPVVACVVGRWKSRLTRAVGHAGAMAGGATTPPRRNAGSSTSSASTASLRPSGRCSRRAVPSSRTSRTYRRPLPQ